VGGRCLAHAYGLVAAGPSVLSYVPGGPASPPAAEAGRECLGSQSVSDIADTLAAGRWRVHIEFGPRLGGAIEWLCFRCITIQTRPCGRDAHMKRRILTDSEMLYLLLSQVILRVPVADVGRFASASRRDHTERYADDRYYSPGGRDAKARIIMLGDTREHWRRRRAAERQFSRATFLDSTCLRLMIRGHLSQYEQYYPEHRRP